MKKQNLGRRRSEQLTYRFRFEDEVKGPSFASGRIAVVGPCASGKSTLVAKLCRRGIDAYSVAQEHSNINHMYLRGQPDYVVYLDISREEMMNRKSKRDANRLQMQNKRLAKARGDADLILDTGQLDAAEACTRVLDFLKGRHQSGE